MKKIICILLSTILTIQICLVSTTANQDELQFSPTNPEYISYCNSTSVYNYSQHSNDDNYNGIIPNEYIIPFIDTTEDQDNLIAMNSLPSSYNSTDNKQYVSPVKNQISLSTCWAFCATACLENNLLKTTSSSNNNEYDFSENHARYATSNTNANAYGFNRTPDDGGNFDYMRTYWLRDKVNGPVNESDDPYDNLPFSNGGSRTVEETENFPKSNVYVKDTIELANLPLAATESQIANHIVDIKNLVYDCGAVYISTRIDINNLNYNTMAYYNSEREATNHAVCIVGWDDNYAISNFKSGQQPSVPGAFIVKNSWGNWGSKGGYYYMSYQCANNFPNVSTVSNVSTRDFYDNIYEYDELGRGNSAGYGKNHTIVGANVFEKNTNTSEAVSAVSTYISAPDTFIKVFICDGDDFSNLEEVSIIGRGAKHNSGYLISNAGSITLELSDKFLINQDKYIVAIEVINENYATPLVIEKSNSNYQYKAHTGESYLASSISSMKSSPSPITDGGNNICIKAYTKNVSNEWNFSNEEFNGYQGITNGTNINGLTFNGEQDLALRLELTQKNINGLSYNRALIMQGGNNLGKNSNDGTVEVKVRGLTEVYIAAKANSDSNVNGAAMHVYTSDSTEIPPEQSDNSYSSGADVKKFIYQNSGADTLRIAPGVSDMKVFAIYVRPIEQIDSTNVNQYWDLQKNTNVYDGLDILSGATFEDYFNKNSYGVIYSEFMSIKGRGDNSKYGIKLYSPANTDIYISARASGTDNMESRKLCLVNEYGYIIGCSGDEYNPDLSTNTLTYRFSYTRDDYCGEDLYIRSLESGIHVYDIKIKTRSENSDTINTEIDFDNTFFDTYIGTVSETINFNNVFKISPNCSIMNRVKTYNGKTYNRCLSLIGQGSSTSKNLKINVPGSVTITVVAANSGANTEIRELALFDENGYIVGRVNINNQLNTYVFNYTGGENMLYLRSKEYGMYLYEVTVVTTSNNNDDDNDINLNYELYNTNTDEKNVTPLSIPDTLESGSAI